MTKHGLPPGWRSIPLSALTREVRISTRPDPATEYELWSVPAYAQGEPERLLGAEIGSTKRVVQPADVLLCKINPRINRVWQVGGRPPSGATQIASPEWIVLRVVDPQGVEPQYLLHFLRSPAFRRRIESTVHGVTGSHTRAQVPELMTAAVPVPPLHEQQRIVEILEDHLSRLDAANDYLDAAATRSAIARRSSAAAAVREAEVSADTREARLVELARIGSGTTPRRGHAPYWRDGSVPWITSGEIAQGVIATASQHVTELALAETALKMWPAGTLLVAMYGEGKTRGTVGELAIPATTNQACAAILLNDNDDTSRAWTRLVLGARYESMRRSSSGGVQPNLTLGFFKAMTLPWPAKATMVRLIAGHEELTQRAAQAGHAIGAAQARASALRRAVLVAAFSGRLAGRSSDLDLAEEMALA